MAAAEEPEVASTDLIYGLDDSPPLQKALLVALQHVFAVFVGMVTPPLLIVGAIDLDWPTFASAQQPKLVEQVNHLSALVVRG